ncbi:serine/threonine protein kinase [Minicystis rosea]|nr:serine/threonine protein kinase [Minicystis rosea]
MSMTCPSPRAGRRCHGRMVIPLDSKFRHDRRWSGHSIDVGSRPEGGKGPMRSEQDPPTFGREVEPRSSGDLVSGSVVGPYVVDRRIARGGCGSVYDARHTVTARRVALKVLHLFLAGQPKMVERFLREVELVNLLHHPGIVEILEVGVLPDRRPFYVMEYLAGGTLEDLLKAKGRLSPEETQEVLDPVCAALAAAHDAGVVHRDVKASNIAFDQDRRTTKLLDFGIAKLLLPNSSEAGLTSVGRRLGTPTVMAPEQLQGGRVDARADVYALGILLYRMLTGRVPFDGKTEGALARQHLDEPPPRPSRTVPLSPAIDAVVLRCLEKQPDRRFSSVGSLATAFAEALGHRRDDATGERTARTRGVAVYLELFVGVAEDDYDEAILADLGHMLDLAEARLRQGGFTLAQATGNAVLGVRLLGGDTRETRVACVAAQAAAESIASAIAEREGADARIHANVAVHTDELVIVPGPEAEIAGGALLCTSAWAKAEPVSGVTVTAEARACFTELGAPLP